MTFSLIIFSRDARALSSSILRRKSARSGGGEGEMTDQSGCNHVSMSILPYLQWPAVSAFVVLA